jgi:hypothetical protein
VALVIDWKRMDRAPKDRPIFILSVQPQEEKGSFHITGDVAQWRGDTFEIGYNLHTSIGHGCATCWCELSEMGIAAAIELEERLDG